MSHTYSNLLLHVIFSAKDRRPCIKPEFKADLHAYIRGIVRELHGVALIVGGTEDHVHLLLKLPATSSASDMVRVVKANASKWVHEKWGESNFGWQTGYGAFTVSTSRVDDVRRYIANQQTHHSKVSFQQEFVAFLRKNGVVFDERYVWD